MAALKRDNILDFNLCQGKDLTLLFLPDKEFVQTLSVYEQLQELLSPDLG